MAVLQLPMSYPDELWYSRLSRYHRRSGNLRTCTTMRELGTGLLNVNHKINIYNSCNAVLNFYLSRHDEEAYWKVVSENTLDPFSLRFFTVKKKEEYYASLHESHRKNLRLIHPMEKDVPALRYCPMCFQEDMQMYGESYWHRFHQIQAVTICPKHLCEILYADIPVTTQTTSKLYCADEYTCPVTEPTPMQHPEQLGPIHYIQQMLESPYDREKEETVDGLKKALIENGYMILNKRQNYEFRRQEDVRDSIIEKYGDYARRIFTENGKKIHLFRMVCTRTIFTAEKFALLMDFFGIPYKEAMQAQTDIVRDTQKIKKLYEIANSGYLWNKSKAAEQLGMNSGQLQTLVNAIGVPRFWGPLRDGETTNLIFAETQRDQHTKVLRVSEDTLKLIKKRVEELGVYNIETYLLYAIKKEQEMNQ